MNNSLGFTSQAKNETLFKNAQIKFNNFILLLLICITVEIF